MRRTRILALAALAAASAVALTGCAVNGGPTQSTLQDAGSGASPSPTTLSGSITVDAAASLSVVYPELAKAFEQQNPGTHIAFTFGGSDSLAAAITNGAPIDVFSAASDATMATVTNAQLTTGTPVRIARNQLEIAVPPGNPGDITGIKDFGKTSKTTVICAATVPCGAAAQKVFTAVGITPHPASEETDVTSVLTKVESGNADAGLVYQTDVQSAGAKVKGIPFAASSDAITDYPIAVIAGSRDESLANAWVAYVRSNEVELQSAGFLAP